MKAKATITAFACFIEIVFLVEQAQGVIKKLQHGIVAFLRLCFYKCNNADLRFIILERELNRQQERAKN